MMNAIKLPFEFDVEQIKKDIENLEEGGHYHLSNPYLEPGSLVGFHLIEPDLVNDLPVFRPNEHLKNSPTLLAIHDTFECDKETYRVHNLRAGYTIRRHRDIGRNYENNIIRLHIPVYSDSEIYTYLDDERVVMKPGECWYMDLDLYHEIHNKSQYDRVNLVMDCLRNEWWEEIFAACGKRDDENPYSHMTAVELEQMKEMMAGMAEETKGPILEQIDAELASRA